jgi:hypothetical protein
VVVTNGPILKLDVEGAGPGETLELPEPRPVRVRVAAESLSACSWLGVRFGAEKVATANDQQRAGGRWLVEHEFAFTPTESGWLAALCTGSAGPALAPTQQWTHAQTGPVLIRVGGRPPARAANDRAALQEAVKEIRDWAEEYGRFDDPKRKHALVARCDEALAKLGEFQ